MLISKKQIMARKSIRSNGNRSSKSSKRSSRRSRRSISKSRKMRAGAYYSFNSKDVVGGLPAVVRHTDDCPSTSPQSADFGTALYGAAKAQTGGACGCGKVIGGARRRRRTSKKATSKKSRSKDRSSGKKGKGSSGKKGKKRSHKKSHKKRGPGC